MGELRKDYILDRWAVISSGRAKRPHQFRKEIKDPDFTDRCFFCPGWETDTPKEHFRINNGKGEWIVRCFPNKFPAVSAPGKSNIETHNRFYTFSDAFGYHDVVVETRDHKKQLWDLSTDGIKLVWQAYIRRFNELKGKEGISYVMIFKNHGREAGTSIMHSHSQIAAYNKIPEIVQQKADAVKKYDRCPYCEIIQKEKDSHRRCFENEKFIAFCPYASRFPFELLVMPKGHLTQIDELDLDCLADIMKKILWKLKELNAAYNYIIHYSPKDENLHFQIEIIPRLSVWAGFEFNGTVINSMPPEDAAKFYRGE